MYPPCPAPGWLTAEALVGAWNVSRGGGRDREMIAERHDYHADGTVQIVELRWRVPSRAELEALTGGPPVGRLTRLETREERTATWRLDAAGVRELRWSVGDTTWLTRGRVWVKRERWRGPHVTLQLRPLAPGADGVWRGELLREQTGPGGARGFTSRLELRFDPPLVGLGGERCAVEVSRHLRVWGEGEPAEWTDKSRHTCSVENNYVRIIDSVFDVRRPGADERLQRAFDVFDAHHVEWVGGDALLLGSYTRDEPETRARAAEPPISRHDVRGIGFCTPKD